MSINLKTKLTSLLVCFVLSLLLTKLFFLSPATRVIGDGNDSYEYLSFQNLVKENILARKYPLSPTNTLRYPTGFDLSYGYDGVFSTFSGAIISFFIPQPLAYNLTLVLILTLNLWCSFLFFNRLNPSPISAFIPSLIFGTSPYIFARLSSHSNLAFVAGFPLLALSIISLVKKLKTSQSFRLIDFLFPMLSVLVIAFGSLQYLLILIYSLIVLTPLAFIIFPKISLPIAKLLISASIQNIRHIFLSVLIFSLIFIYFYQGYILAIFRNELVHDPGKVISYQQYAKPNLMDVFLINSYQGSIWSKLNSSIPSIEKVISLGVIGWLLLLISFFKKPYSRFRLLILLYFIYFLASALGLFYLPLFPEGGRQIVIFSFMVSSLLCFTLSVPKSLSLVILFLLIAERLTFSLNSTPILSPAVQNQLNRLPGQAILNLPASKYTAYYSHIPAVTNKKIVDGYFHYMADNQKAGTFLSQDYLQRFFCQSEKPIPENYQITQKDPEKVLKLLKDNGIRTILFHKNSKFYFDGCTGLRQWWYSLNPKTIGLSTQNQGFQTESFEFISYPNMSIRFFAKDQGNLTINGLLLYPKILNNSYLLNPDQSITPITWADDQNGIKTTPDFIHSQSLLPGESLYLQAPQKLYQTVYLTVWYTFDSANTQTSSPPPIQLVYEDNDVQIYKIN